MIVLHTFCFTCKINRNGQKSTMSTVRTNHQEREKVIEWFKKQCFIIFFDKIPTKSNLHFFLLCCLLLQI